LTNAELLAADINQLNKIIKSAAGDVKILMWDDMLNLWHNGGGDDYQVKWGGINGQTALALDLIPKDIYLMVWWYDKNDQRGKMKNSLDYFGEKGFSCFICPWNNRENILNWIKLTSNKKRCKGMIITNWQGWRSNLENIELMAVKAWEGE